MFLPPEQRHPGSSPGDPPAPKPAAPSHAETWVLWLIGLCLLATFLAPVGGSSVIEALWYLIRR